MSLKVFNISIVVLGVFIFAGNTKECRAGAWKDIQESETWESVKGQVSTRIALCKLQMALTNADVDRYRHNLWNVRLEAVGKTMSAYPKPSAEAFSLIDTTESVQEAKQTLEDEKMRIQQMENWEEPVVDPDTGVVCETYSNGHLLPQSRSSDGDDGGDERDRREQEFWDNYKEDEATAVALEVSKFDQGGPGARKPSRLPRPNFPRNVESE